MDEKKLTLARRVIAALRGDTGSYEVLFKETAPDIWEICKKYFSNDEDAKAALESTYSVVAEKFAEQKDPTDVVGWIKRIAHITCAEKAAKFGGLADAEVKDLNLLTLSDYKKEKKDGVLTAATVADLTEKVLKVLPQRQRTELLLWNEGYDVAEIAKKLGISPGSVVGGLNVAKTKVEEETAKWEKDGFDYTKYAASPIGFFTRLMREKFDGSYVYTLPEKSGWTWTSIWDGIKGNLKWPTAAVGTAAAAGLVTKFKDIDLNLPGFDWKAADVDVKVPDVDVKKVDVELPKVDVDVKKPEVDVDLKKVDVDLPKVDVDVKKPEVDVDLKKVGAAVAAGAAAVGAAAAKVKDVDVNLPKVDVDVKKPEVDVDLKKVDVDLPKVDVDVKKPDVDVKLPKVDVDVKKPDVDVKLPKVDVDVKKPDVDVKKVGAAAAAGAAAVGAAAAAKAKDVKLPDVDVKAKAADVKADVKAGAATVKKDVDDKAAAAAAAVGKKRGLSGIWKWLLPLLLLLLLLGLLIGGLRGCNGSKVDTGDISVSKPDLSIKTPAVGSGKLTGDLDANWVSEADWDVDVKTETVPVSVNGSTLNINTIDVNTFLAGLNVINQNPLAYVRYETSNAGTDLGKLATLFPNIPEINNGTLQTLKYTTALGAEKSIKFDIANGKVASVGLYDADDVLSEELVYNYVDGTLETITVNSNFKKNGTPKKSETINYAELVTATNSEEENGKVVRETVGDDWAAYQYNEDGNVSVVAYNVDGTEGARAFAYGDNGALKTYQSFQNIIK